MFSREILSHVSERIELKISIGEDRFHNFCYYSSCLVG